MRSVTVFEKNIGILITLQGWMEGEGIRPGAEG